MFQRYASTFRFCGDYVDCKDTDPIGRLKTRIIAIDALCCPGWKQYGSECLLRSQALAEDLCPMKPILNSSVFQQDDSCKPPMLSSLAQDGSGQLFKIIMEAIKTVPQNTSHTFIILIKAGVYNEYVEIPRSANNLVLMGEGPNVTRITGNKNYIDGLDTYSTATVVVSVSRSNQAAVRGPSCLMYDFTIVFNCQLDGYQDTLYAHMYRQFYRDTIITGTIDFVFVDAQAIYQTCTMVVRMPLEQQQCVVIAQGRGEERGVGGFVVQNSSFVAIPEFLKAP